jgi:hypothetical protein
VSATPSVVLLREQLPLLRTLFVDLVSQLLHIRLDKKTMQWVGVDEVGRGRIQRIQSV